MNSFLWFLGVFTLSLILLFLWPDVPVLKGILLLLWAVLGLVRGLWMSELVFFGHVGQEEPGSPLSPALVKALRLNQDKGLARERSYKASSAFTDRSLAAVVLGALYLLWLIGMIVLARPPEAYADLARLIGEVLSRQGAAPFHPVYPSPILTLSALADILMVGLAFWLAQSFASSYRQVPVFLGFALTGLCVSGAAVLLTGDALPVTPGVSLTGQWIGYGYGMAPLLHAMEIIPEAPLSTFYVRAYEMGMGAAVYLYVLGLYLMLSFLAALGRGPYQKGQAVLGLAVLLALVMADRLLPADPRLESVWLAGWGALGVLSVQCRSIGHKSARMRQV
jgi:hypothetical protein